MCDLEPPHPGHHDPSYIAACILAANKKWACRLNQTCPEYFPDPQAAQRPKILWLGCSDSRVLESDATMARPGDVFVHRNIANQFHLDDDNVLSVVAYALRALAVQHIIVVGHTNCGGVLTAMKHAGSHPNDLEPRGHFKLIDSLYYETDDPVQYSSKPEADDPVQYSAKPSEGQLVDPNSALDRWLTPLVERLRSFVPRLQQEDATEENVKLQVENLTKLGGYVRANALKRPVWVHGWVYDFSTGFIKNLHITRELGAKGGA